MRISTLLLLLFPFMTLAQLQIELNTFATGFNRPVDIQNASDSRLFIVEQPGQIWILDSDGIKSSTPFLDIRNRVNDNGNEQGLLGLAFPPDYQTNRNFIVHYTANNGSTQISLFSTTSNRDSADPNSEFSIINFAQPFANHNGGSIEFGPNGYLYIAMGDGGSAGDPNNSGQDLTSLLGKILRININTAMPYGIPPDNPFVGAGGGVREEIWAYGLRNPWKICFDALTNDIWIADVGQDGWEEVDFQPASSLGGENYGWRCREGAHPFDTTGCPPDSTMVDPVYEYPHPTGCSITGGRVYRGSKYPGMLGQYFFADICGGWIRSLDQNFNMTDHGTFSSSTFFVAFGENSSGDLFVAGLNDGIISEIRETQSSIESHIEIGQNIVYPNPFSDQTTIRYPGKRGFPATLEIKSISGKLVRVKEFPGGNSIVLHRDSLTSGAYLYSISQRGEILCTGKLIIQ